MFSLLLLIEFLFFGKISGSFLMTIDFDGDYDMLDMTMYIQQTSDEGFILTGNTYSSSDNYFDIFLSKFTSDGTHSWSTIIGFVDSNNDQAYSVQQTSVGGYIVAGTTECHDDEVYPEMYFLLSKFDSDGSHTWSKALCGNSEYESAAYSVLETSDSDYIVVGDVYNVGSDDNALESDVRSILIAKFGNTGTLKWARALSGQGSSIHVQPTDDDSAFVLVGSGYFSGSQNELLLTKFSTDGSIHWSTTLGFEVEEMVSCSGVLQSNDGGFLVTGSIERVISTLSKFSSEGVHLWTHSLDLSSIDIHLTFSGRVLQDTNDGSIYFAGGSYVFPSSSMGVSKFTSDGTYIWTKTIDSGEVWGEESGVMAFSGTLTSDQEIAVVGTATVEQISGGGNYTQTDNIGLFSVMDSDGEDCNWMTISDDDVQVGYPTVTSTNDVVFSADITEIFDLNLISKTTWEESVNPIITMECQIEDDDQTDDDDDDTFGFRDSGFSFSCFGFFHLLIVFIFLFRD